MNLEFIKSQNLGSLLMKSSQSNFNLRSPSSYLVRSYLITTVFSKGSNKISFLSFWIKSCQNKGVEIHMYWTFFVAKQLVRIVDKTVVFEMNQIVLR